MSVLIDHILDVFIAIHHEIAQASDTGNAMIEISQKKIWGVPPLHHHQGVH